MKNWLFFFLFAVSSQAQTHRFIYEVKYKKDSTENIVTKEYYHLDINSDGILYYDRTFFESDSIKKTNRDFPAPNMNMILSHKKNIKTFISYEFLGWDIIKRMSEPSQNWKLLNERKATENYTIQKATTKWAGRNWTAWFTTEIPFQEGPYKFHSLPGLITQVTDDKGDFSFKLIKSQNFSTTQKIDLFENVFGRAIFFDENKYEKLKLNFYEDPLMYTKNGQVDLSKTEGVILEDGTMVTEANVREVSNIQRKKLKKYNNPIELDKAIYYPQK